MRPAYLKKMYEACEAHDATWRSAQWRTYQENGKPLPEPVFTPPTQEGVFRGKDLLNDFYAPNGTYYTVAWNKLYRAEVWKLLHYPEAVCTRMILWRTGCSGGAISGVPAGCFVQLPPAFRQHYAHQPETRRV